MFKIDCFDFDDNAPGKIMELRHGKNYVGLSWPVAYVLNNEKEAYVGETIHASQRASQHLTNQDRRKLTEIRIISDETFNKSVILDLEAFLIKHMHADGKYELQNGNNGLQDHDYYQKSEYKDEFEKIWNKLRQLGVVTNSIEDIENSELFKYSPYKSLGVEQLRAEMEIIQALLKSLQTGERCTVIVKGGAGTGKTILGIYLMKFFADIAKGTGFSFLLSEEEPGDEFEEIYADERLQAIQKIGLVIPQKSLQTSVKNVFDGVKNLEKKMVLSPVDVVKDYLKTGKRYDLLIVDEAHRLKCRNKGHLANYRSFDQCNRDLGLDKYEGTELDWLMMCSKNIIMFRDELQTVRPCDIDGEDFNRITGIKYGGNLNFSQLETQWRCEGGEDYIDYLRQILSCRQKEKRDIDHYDVRLYRRCDEMIKDIKRLNTEMGLCRVVAGYAWTWNRNKPQEFTIEIQDKKYRWNRSYDNWIQTPTAIDEIGCIHTVQGYDLNYTGVIIGEDIKYDPDTGEIYAVKQNYYDQQGKAGVADDPEGLRNYLTNIYLTLLTRGIKGTYIYVCDDELRKYFERFFDVQE